VTRRSNPALERDEPAVRRQGRGDRHPRRPVPGADLEHLPSPRRPNQDHQQFCHVLSHSGLIRGVSGGEGFAGFLNASMTITL
jgi:hypothetical protein